MIQLLKVYIKMTTMTNALIYFDWCCYTFIKGLFYAVFANMYCNYFSYHKQFLQTYVLDTFPETGWKQGNDKYGQMHRFA